MELKGRYSPVEDLTTTEHDAMYALMSEYYENVERESFLQDLRKKQWVILMTDDGVLRGFSTLELFSHEVDGQRVLVLYSGDTIIARTHWGTWALPVTWVKLVLSIEEAHPDQPLYWLLTTKGYKTYRFLPVFMQEFYPCQERTPAAFEQALAESLAASRFPHRRFDPKRWVLTVENGGQRLKDGVAEIEEHQRKDPHVAFFERENPGHSDGDELLCLSRASVANLKRFVVDRARKA